MLYYLGEVRGASPKAGCQRCEGCDVLSQGGVYPDASIGYPIECHLVGTEEASGAWYGLGHKAKLPEDLAPLLLGYAFGRGQLSKDLG